jgi:hypothetical protein
MNKTAKLLTLIMATVIITSSITPVFALPKGVKLGGKGTATVIASGEEYKVQLRFVLKIMGENTTIIEGSDGQVRLLIQAGFPLVNDEREYLFRVNNWHYHKGTKFLHINAEADNGYTMTLEGTGSTNPKNGKIQFELTGTIKDDKNNQIVTLHIYAIAIGKERLFVF